MSDLVFEGGDGAPRRLIIVLHGVGSSAADMAPVAEALARRVPQTRVLVPDGFEPFDGGGAGRQWFSVRGVTEANRAARVHAVLPDLLAWIEARRGEAGIEPDAVGLFGFSQGAILALAIAARGYALGAVVAAAGRLVDPVQRAASASPRLLLVHGSADGVIPIEEGELATWRLNARGYRATFRRQEGQGHSVSPAQVDLAADWFAD